MKKIGLVILVVCIVAAVGLFAGGKEEGEGEKLVFGNIQPGPDPWYQYSVKAFTYFAEAAGVEVVYLNSEYDQDKDIANIEDLIAQGVDVISVFPMTADLGAQYINKAKDAGIPVVFEAVQPSGGSQDYVTVVSFSYAMLGGLIAEYVHDNHPGAKLAYITGKPGTGIVEQYVDGVESTLKRLNSTVELVSVQPTDWDRMQAMEITENLLQSGMELDVIFANNEDMAGGVIQVLKEADMLDKISVVSTGGSPEGIQLIRAGELEATACGSAGLEGALCFVAAMRQLEGKSVPKLINPPVFLATKDNIDTALTWEVTDTLIDIVENYQF